MTDIYFQCMDQALCLDGVAEVASGGRDTNAVHFSFCRQWDGFVKDAVFCPKGGEAITRPLDGDACFIPAHLMARDGILYIGAIGTNAEGVTRTSQLQACRVRMGAINPMTKPPAPTVEVYEQVLALIASKAPPADAIQRIEKGAPDGVVPLDKTGRVPMELFDGMFFPQLVVTAEGGSMLTCICGETRLTVQTPDAGTAIIDLPALGEWTVNGYRPGGKSITATVLVEQVQQYHLNFDLEFVAGLTVKTGKPLAQVTATCLETSAVVEATAGADGIASMVLTERGEWAVSVYHAGLPFPTGSVDATEDGGAYALDLHYFDTVLENNTWAWVALAAEQGLASQLWQVGDTKTIYDNKGRAQNVAVIVGFDHDELADGTGHASITFAYQVADDYDTMGVASGKAYPISFVGTACYVNRLKNGKWEDAHFSDDLRAAVKLVNKRTLDNDGKGETFIRTDAMTVFLFSAVEVVGPAYEGDVFDEGEQYAYFATAENRQLLNEDGVAQRWWLRSPVDGDYYTGRSWYYMSADGAERVFTTAPDTTNLYLRPGFCI